MKPQIGVWWDDGRTIVAFPHEPGRPSQITGLCDSENSHNDLWPEAAMRYDAGEDDEYFSIPRGRVLWNPEKVQSIVCRGNETSATKLKEIAAIFKLTDWTAHTDIHYVMGNAADHAFDD